MITKSFKIFVIYYCHQWITLNIWAFIFIIIVALSTVSLSMEKNSIILNVITAKSIFQYCATYGEFNARGYRRHVACTWNTNNNDYIFQSNNYCQCAERNLLNVCENIDVLYITHLHQKWKRNGKLLMSKPCRDCLQKLKESSVKFIVYTENDDIIRATTLERLLKSPIYERKNCRIV